jgi:hypothetical protein
MYNADDHRQMEAELLNAEAARSRGAEGQARVCSRRAAGIAIRVFLAENGEAVRGMNAYDLIQALRDRPGISAQVKAVATHLSTRVNQQFNLPGEYDLIAETRWLISELDLARRAG